MKKWKLILVSAAIAVGIGGAFASKAKECQLCSYYDQYRLWNGAYVYAGEEGVDYACVSGGGVCTYYKPTLSSPYYPCQTGSFYQLLAKTKK
jgi:hypothetical protein